MKGMLFTEFMELVESRMGPEMLDRIITDAQLPNDGAYTAVGTYNHEELVRLAIALSKATGMPLPALVHFVGYHLFPRFFESAAELFQGVDNVFDCLGRIDSVIHAEVRKLYPDAELPALPCTRLSDNEIELMYSSPRGLADLAAGLIDGCIAYYKEPIKVTRADLEKEGNLHRTRFHLQVEAV